MTHYHLLTRQGYVIRCLIVMIESPSHWKSYETQSLIL